MKQINMFKYKVLSLIISAIAVTHIVQGQTTPTGMSDKLSVDLLKEDFRTLRSKLESSQPGLYLIQAKTRWIKYLS